MARGAVMVLDHYLSPQMRGLEWSAGSGSLWALRRLQHLYSVEHDLPWAKQLQQLVSTQYPQLVQKWSLVGVPCVDITTGACHQNGPQSEGANTDYTQYVRAPWDRLRHSFPLDYVLVDGRARSECIEQVLMADMLDPSYGILVLDNSERDYNTSDIPSHWPCVSLRSAERGGGVIDETTIWMRCAKHDPECAKARHAIVDTVRNIVPPHQAGTGCRRTRHRHPELPRAWPRFGSRGELG